MKCFFSVSNTVYCPFEQSFEVVTDRCHQQALVCQFDPAGVHPSHVQEVDEGTDHWFNSRLSQFLQTSGFADLPPLMHLVVEGFIHRVFDLFKVTIADAKNYEAENACNPGSTRYAGSPHTGCFFVKQWFSIRSVSLHFRMIFLKDLSNVLDKSRLVKG